MYRLSATDTKGQCFRKCIASTKISNEHSSSCHDVWRLLIFSNEEKTNDYENFEKGMIYMKILKKGGGSREKGGGGNEIHAPCACEARQKVANVSEERTTLYIYTCIVGNQW